MYAGNVFYEKISKKKLKKTLKKIYKELSKCSLIVIRTSGLHTAESKPCRDCTEQLKKLGIKKVYYSSGREIVSERVMDLETSHVCRGQRKM